MIRKIANGITWVLVAVMLGFAALVLGPRAAGMQTYAVLTGSMEPTIPTGSLVYVQQVGAGELAVGDVITFRLQSGAVVTHRIQAIDAAGNFTTQGDANNAADMAAVTAPQVLGRVRFHIPCLGAVCELIKTPAGILAVTAVLILLLLAVFLPEILAEDGKKHTAEHAK